MALTRASASTRYTYEFVTATLPSQSRRILEVGCGDGALAALLQADGLDVLAIDNDPQAVEAAIAAGVETRLVSWPSEMSERFDAVLFTRSLHHIEPLDEAVAAARDALQPNGRMIVEDFRAEGGGEDGARWFSDLARSMIADGALTPGTTIDELIEQLAPGDHDLHSSSAIVAALRGIGSVEATDAAYYFRYLEPHLSQPAAGRELLERELALIAAGSIDPLGKRFVVQLS